MLLNRLNHLGSLGAFSKSLVIHQTISHSTDDKFWRLDQPLFDFSINFFSSKQHRQHRLDPRITLPSLIMTFYRGSHDESGSDGDDLGVCEKLLVTTTIDWMGSIGQLTRRLLPLWISYPLCLCMLIMSLQLEYALQKKGDAPIADRLDLFSKV